MSLRGVVLSFALCACGGLPGPGPGPVVDGGADAGRPDAGSLDAGLVTDAGPLDVDGGWSWVAVPGSQCASGSTTGFGYSPGDGETLLVFLQGGGACWNNGTCRPSVFRWGPVCNYGENNVCLWDAEGGTKPLAAHVAEADPFPVDGGGAFPGEIALVAQNLLFARRAENPLAAATQVYVPYCTGDLHDGNATRTYSTKADLFAQPVQHQHHFAGAQNMTLFLAELRARHPNVKTIYLTGVSGGGYGASLNFERVRHAFPEATVHLLADSSPMLSTPHWEAWRNEMNLELPATCSECDAGLPQTMKYMMESAPQSRLALLVFTGDETITRFFFAGNDTASWLTPNTAAYSAAVGELRPIYDAHPNAAYFALGGSSHVMINGYGVVQSDGGITAPATTPDGGSLKAWIDRWIDGGTFTSAE